MAQGQWLRNGVLALIVAGTGAALATGPAYTAPASDAKPVAEGEGKHGKGMGESAGRHAGGVDGGDPDMAKSAQDDRDMRADRHTESRKQKEGPGAAPVDGPRGTPQAGGKHPADAPRGADSATMTPRP